MCIWDVYTLALAAACHGLWRGIQPPASRHTGLCTRPFHAHLLHWRRQSHGDYGFGAGRHFARLDAHTAAGGYFHARMRLRSIRLWLERRGFWPAYKLRDRAGVAPAAEY